MEALSIRRGTVELVLPVETGVVAIIEPPGSFEMLSTTGVDRMVVVRVHGGEWHEAVLTQTVTCKIGNTL